MRSLPRTVLALAAALFAATQACAAAQAAPDLRPPEISAFVSLPEAAARPAAAGLSVVLAAPPSVLPAAAASAPAAAASPAPVSASAQLQATAAPDAAPAPASAAFDGSVLRRILYGTALGNAVVGMAASRRLVTALRSKIAAEPALAPHAAFLAEHPMKIEVAHLPVDEFARFEQPEFGGEPTVKLNFANVAYWLGQLGARGARLPEAIDSLARALLPTLGHEIRHAITKRQWRTGLGIDLLSGSREDEVISWADELKIWQALGAARTGIEDIDEEQAFSAGRWAKDGWQGLEKVVAELYPDAPSFLAEDVRPLRAIVRTEEQRQRDRARFLGLSEASLQEDLGRQGITRLLRSMPRPADWDRFRREFRAIYDRQRREVSPSVGGRPLDLGQVGDVVEKTHQAR